MLVVGGDESFGNLISFVQPLDLVHPPPFAILGDEVSVDDCRLFVHELLPLGARGPGNQQKHLEYIAGSG